MIRKLLILGAVIAVGLAISPYIRIEAASAGRSATCASCDAGIQAAQQSKACAGPGCSVASGAGNCAAFSACSVDRNLNGATGAELERYKKEKAEDGRTYTGFQAPRFEVPATDGSRLSLDEHAGSPVAVVFLAGHCQHSLDTLPILSRAQQKFGEDIAILPIYVNSGRVEDVRDWSSHLDLDLSLGVAPDRTISNAYDVRMVPSTFLIDKDGKVSKRLVGFKDENTLNQVLAEHIRNQRA